jgi:hypothetical protein
MAAVRAKDSFTGPVAELGFAPVVPAGTVLDETDPIVRAFPALFEPVEEAIARMGTSVEQATANPSELRDKEIPVPKGRRPRARKAPAEKRA